MPQPLRSKQEHLVTDDPKTGQDRTLEVCDEVNVLSDQGSVDTGVRRKVFSLDCGCMASPAGRCALCGKLSCANCHGRCDRCAAPICLEHSAFFEQPGGCRIRMCRLCNESAVRRHRAVTFAKVLLSPFVRFDHE